MSGKFNLHWLGRFGNNCLQYAFARGYCERYKLTLHTDPWIGESIFDISHPRCDEELPRIAETKLSDALGNVSFRSYSQSQVCADFYSLTQVRKWLRLRPHIEEMLAKVTTVRHEPYAHLRRGDFQDYNYPLVSLKSVLNAVKEFGLPWAIPGFICVVSDDDPTVLEEFPGEMDFLPDFYLLMKAPYMLRANSSFSMVAGMLNTGRVFSPVIDGLEGGKEHDCQYVEGLWPRLSSHDFVTNMHISP